ncbi:hypothetical protein CERZMDRAFT_113659 [Cercospora zeae-maydis SCOH1-5]|uniref:Uncharacterized protein n=1 Tax=Cercospora zeae-maydis SCOH1-5 TaxID=717836 RepID=A0A6A6F981_9PEZI|nr:hypothetical protein CERZMDRAFT_113659 [Cercospora zeae-maydis SCOH1-5]
MNSLMISLLLSLFSLSLSLSLTPTRHVFFGWISTPVSMLNTPHSTFSMSPER